MRLQIELRGLLAKYRTSVRLQNAVPALQMVPQLRVGIRKRYPRRAKRRLMKPVAAIIAPLIQNTGGTPKAVPTAPNTMGPSTRTALVVVRRIPRVRPERPAEERSNMSITVTGVPAPMPSPKTKAAIASEAMSCTSGTTAKPSAPA